LPIKPLGYYGNYAADLVVCELPAFGDAVPLLQAAAAAGGCGVLGDKDGVVSHGGLLAIIGWLGWRQPLADERLGMLPYDSLALVLVVLKLLALEFEPTPEG
jgi:hypothetical protein